MVYLPLGTGAKCRHAEPGQARAGEAGPHGRRGLEGRRQGWAGQILLAALSSTCKRVIVLAASYSTIKRVTVLAASPDTRQRLIACRVVLSTTSTTYNPSLLKVICIV